MRRPTPDLLVGLRSRLGDDFPHDKQVASAFYRCIRRAIQRYKFALALFASDAADKEIAVATDLVIEHAEALLVLLAEKDSSDRYDYVPKGAGIGRPALRVLPRLLGPRRLNSFGVVEESRITSVRVDLKWLLDRAKSLKEIHEMDWKQERKRPRRRGLRKGEQALRADLAVACYQALTAAGIPGHTFRQKKRVSSRVYVRLESLVWLGSGWS